MHLYMYADIDRDTPSQTLEREASRRRKLETKSLQLGTRERKGRGDHHELGEGSIPIIYNFLAKRRRNLLWFSEGSTTRVFMVWSRLGRPLPWSLASLNRLTKEIPVGCPLIVAWLILLCCCRVRRRGTHDHRSKCLGERRAIPRSSRPGTTTERQAFPS
jgi:hypothetical protein